MKTKILMQSIAHIQITFIFAYELICLYELKQLFTIFLE